MPLDSPIFDGGLIRIDGREYGTSEYIARTFGKRGRTIRRWGLPHIKVSNPVLYDLARTPEWDRKANPGRAGTTGLTPACRSVLGAWR
jgi:hypothetical protein